MLRLSASQRLAGTALVVVAVAGIGFGAYRLASAAGLRHEAPLVAAATSSVPAPSSPSAASPSSSSVPSSPSPAAAPALPLTLDQAKAVAFRAAGGGGRVVEASEDAEPTGLLFDVTVLHPNGSATKVEVDAASGRVVSLEQDDHWD